MADKKKMTLAERIAAKNGGGAAPASNDQAATPEAAPTGKLTLAQKIALKKSGGAAPAPAATGETPAAAAPTGKLTLAQKIALKKSGGAAPTAAAAPAAKAPPKKKAASNKPVKTGPLDTGSILGKIHNANKPGPISKAEAEKRPKPTTKKKKKAPIIVPAMPAKPDFKKKKAATTKKKAAAGTEDRRGFVAFIVGLVAFAATCTLSGLGVARFLFPNVLREPPSKFKVGFRDQFPTGQVQTKYKAQYGTWIVNTVYNGEQQLVAIQSICTHLGCTPNWLESEQKFKCPCHGSGFYKDGINFEGPAPRPLERFAIRIADDGQVEVDKSQTFQEEMGEWSDPGCYIPA